MPSFVIEFDSNHGPERRLFTLDDDRSLDVQLFQVLEELRQSGRIVSGAPGDELAVSWNGRELPMREPLAALGLDASRPLVLHMRARVEPVVPELTAVAPRYTLRHVFLPPVEGALGALAAWSLAGMLADWMTGPGTLAVAARPWTVRPDVGVAMLLALTVSIALATGSLVRGVYRAPVAIACVVASVTAGVVFMPATVLVEASPTIREFLLARMVGWLALCLGLALVHAAPLRDLGAQRYVEALVFALFGGVLCALVASLPGSSELWQLMAFITAGALVGAGALSFPIWRSLAVAARPTARAAQSTGAVPGSVASGQPA